MAGQRLIDCLSDFALATKELFNNMIFNFDNNISKEL